MRTVSADIVCLQEVMGAHEVHPMHFENWPDTPHYEFLADTMWSDYAYGRNAVYPEGHHGNAVLSRFPIEHYENRDVSVGESEKRGLLYCRITPRRSIFPFMWAVFILACVKPTVRPSYRCWQTGPMRCRRASPSWWPVISTTGDSGPTIR